MSKYIKLEDAIHNINLEVTGRKEYTGDMKANLFFALDDLPTIEVSEEKGTLEDILKASLMLADLPPIEVMEYPQVKGITPTLVTPKVSEDNAIRIVEKECFRDDLSKEIKDYLFSDLRHKLYHEQAEVSEDCIDRDLIISQLLNLMTVEKEHYEGMDKALKLIENAPSVVPSRAEGEWKRHPIPENRAWDICTACGIGCRRRHYGFNEDGTEWVEQANNPFCPNCGAKMRNK